MRTTVKYFHRLAASYASTGSKVPLIRLIQFLSHFQERIRLPPARAAAMVINTQRRIP